MNRHKIKSIALMVLLASLMSFTAGCHYQAHDRSDYGRRWDRYDRTYDRYYDRRYDSRYDRYYDNRYAWRNRDRDRYYD